MKDAEHVLTIASVTSAVDEPDLLKKMQSAARVIGFDHVLAGIQWQPRAVAPIQRIVSGWPAAYQQRYAERGLIALDPTVPYCQTHTSPLEWTEAMYTTEGSREVLEESRRFGLGHGLSVPVHENRQIVSMLSLARDRPFDNQGERELVTAAGLVLANCAHVVIKRVLFPRFAQEVLGELSRQELECLKGLLKARAPR